MRIAIVISLLVDLCDFSFTEKITCYLSFYRLILQCLLPCFREREVLFQPSTITIHFILILPHLLPLVSVSSFKILRAEETIYKKAQR